MATFNTATTQAIEVDGASLVFRELGTKGGVPVIFLHHLTEAPDERTRRVQPHRVTWFTGRLFTSLLLSRHVHDFGATT